MVTFGPVKVYFHRSAIPTVCLKYILSVLPLILGRGHTWPSESILFYCHSRLPSALRKHFSVTSDFRQSSSTRRTFKTSNGPTSASSKGDTTLRVCYANKPWQICQSEKFAVAYEFVFCSVQQTLANRLFRFSLNEESRWIKKTMRKKKRLLLDDVYDYFLLHAPNLNDMLFIFVTTAKKAGSHYVVALQECPYGARGSLGCPAHATWLVIFIALVQD